MGNASSRYISLDIFSILLHRNAGIGSQDWNQDWKSRGRFADKGGSHVSGGCDCWAEWRFGLSGWHLLACRHCTERTAPCKTRDIQHNLCLEATTTGHQSPNPTHNTNSNSTAPIPILVAASSQSTWTVRAVSQKTHIVVPGGQSSRGLSSREQ